MRKTKSKLLNLADTNLCRVLQTSATVNTISREKVVPGNSQNHSLFTDYLSVGDFNMNSSLLKKANVLETFSTNIKKTFRIKPNHNVYEVNF